MDGVYIFCGHGLKSLAYILKEYSKSIIIWNYPEWDLRSEEIVVEDIFYEEKYDGDILEIDMSSSNSLPRLRDQRESLVPLYGYTHGIFLLSKKTFFKDFKKL